MSTKSELLSILEKNKGNYISGQELADKLKVSRTAVWKAIKDLQADDYVIDAITNKGYSLSSTSNILSEEAIRQNLAPKNKHCNLKIYKSVDSSNNEAKRLIIDGCEYDTVIFAEEQTAGKGRRGKSFVSPKGDNIYVSFILKPMVDVRDSLLVTVGASVAVARAVHRIGLKYNMDYNAGIKWVNDLYLNGKKFVGILTEAVTDLENGEIQNLVLGIGININSDAKEYPDELHDIIGSIEIMPGEKNFVAATLVNEVYKMQQELAEYSSGLYDEPEFMKEYREQSIVIGRDINVIKNDSHIEAHAFGIDGRGGLMVKYKTGETETLSTGEISIRVI